MEGCFDFSVLRPQTFGTLKGVVSFENRGPQVQDHDPHDGQGLRRDGHVDLGQVLGGGRGAGGGVRGEGEGGGADEAWWVFLFYLFFLGFFFLFFFAWFSISCGFFRVTGGERFVFFIPLLKLEVGSCELGFWVMCAPLYISVCFLARMKEGHRFSPSKRRMDGWMGWRAGNQQLAYACTMYLFG